MILCAIIAILIVMEIDISRFKDKKIALVLSGGVVKAAGWHLGVAMALEEIGFTLKHNDSPEASHEISTYVGSSAGAMLNVFFASGKRPISIAESFLDPSNADFPPFSYKDMLCRKKPEFMKKESIPYAPTSTFPWIIKSILKPILNMPGLFTTQGLHDYLEKHIIVSNNFKDYDADLFITATQLDHSRKVIFSKYKYPNARHDSTSTYYVNTPISDSVAASMAVPPFYAPFPIKNEHTGEIDYYIDGEIRETLSTHVAEDNNCDYAISSWTHTPYHYNNEIGSLINYGLPAICVQSIYLLIQKKIISARARTQASKDVIDTVNDYMKKNFMPDKQRKDLLAILERKLFYKKKLKLIDIYPKHEDFKFFFGNSFSLNPKSTSLFVKRGYLRTFEIFKSLE